MVGIATNADGNVYVAERLSVDTLGGYKGWIRRFSSQGVEVPYSVPTSDFHPGAVAVLHPTGIAADAAGNVYVACGGRVSRQIPTGSNTTCSGIEKVSPSGELSTVAGRSAAVGTSGEGSTDGPGPTATFRLPQDVAVGPQGHIVVADTGNHTIRQIAP